MFIKRFWGLGGRDVCPGAHVAAQGGGMMTHGHMHKGKGAARLLNRKWIQV